MKMVTKRVLLSTLLIIAIISFLTFSITQIAASNESSNPSEEIVNGFVSNHKIFIGSKSYCPYCRRVKNVLSDWKIDHVILGEGSSGGDSRPSDALVVERGDDTEQVS